MPFDRVNWGPGRKKDFASWISEEIFNTEGDRHQLVRKWKDLQDRHRARILGDGTSDVPFVGASDLEYPLSAIHFEPVYADLMQTLHLPTNFWSITPSNPAGVETAKPLEEAVSLVEKKDIRMRTVNSRALVDLIVLGTCIFKDYIEYDRRLVWDYNDFGEIEKIQKTKIRPRVVHINLQDFWIPAYAWRINPDEDGGAPWVAHRFNLTPSQLRQRAKSDSPNLPTYDPKAVDAVLRTESDDEDEIRENQQRHDEYVPFKDRSIELFEVWARFDIDGDGIDEDIVVVWSQKAKVILRATYNPFLHGERPFEAVPYIPSFGFYGVGIVEADEWAQLAMTRLLNAAIDNTLIANSRMYALPLGANIDPDEEIFPSKVWLLPPGESITPVQMGEVYPSLFHLMDRFMQWSESRTGVSELRQGNISNLPGRTPASTVLSVLNEGTKKFDMVLNNLREAYSRIGRRVLQNLVQISHTDNTYRNLFIQTLGERDGQKVAEVLAMPVHEASEAFGVKVTATSSQTNKEVEKQSLLGLAQIASQIYPQLISYAQAIAQTRQDPTVLIDTVESAYRGQAELFKRLLEPFNVQNPEQYLPRVALEQEQQPAAEPVSPEAAPLGGPSGPGPLAQGSGFLSQILGVE